jgi:hypothetical protein
MVDWKLFQNEVPQKDGYYLYLRTRLSIPTVAYWDKNEWKDYHAGFNVHILYNPYYWAEVNLPQ